MEMRYKLHNAIVDENIEAVTELLSSQDTDVNEKNPEDKSPLHLAVITECKEILELLLKSRGIDINVKDANGDTALHLAADKLFVDILKMLLKLGADANSKNGFESTPLHVVAKNGHLENARLLLEAGARPNVVNSDGQTPMHAAALNVESRVLKLLVTNGGDVNVKSNTGYTALQHSVKKGDFDSVKVLTDARSCLKVRDSFGRNLLHEAVEINNPRILEHLLSAGKIDPNARDGSGRTPLHDAALMSVKDSHFVVAEMLLRNDANASAKDSEEKTPLDYLFAFETQKFNPRLHRLFLKYEYCMNLPSVPKGGEIVRGFNRCSLEDVDKTLEFSDYVCFFFTVFILIVAFVLVLVLDSR